LRYEEHHQPQTGHPHSATGFSPSAAAAAATIRILPLLFLTIQPCLTVICYPHSGTFPLKLKTLSREGPFPIIEVKFFFRNTTCVQELDAGGEVR